MGLSLPSPLHFIKDAVDSAAHDVNNDVLHPIERDVLTPVSNALSVPEAMVQHQYRYIHERWTRDGTLAGLQALVSQGGIGEGYALSERVAGNNQQDWTQSQAFLKTADGARYRDIYGNAVNPGFDAANFIDHIFHGRDYMPNGWTRDANGVMQPDGSGGIDFATGAINAGFDVVTDPTLRVGGLIKLAKVDGIVSGAKTVALSTDAAERDQQIAELAQSGKRFAVNADGTHAYVGGRVYTSGRGIRTWNDFNGMDANNVPYLAVNSPAVRDAFMRMKDMNAEQLLNAWPGLRDDARLVRDLSEANTFDDVVRTWEEAVNIRNYGFLRRGLPTTSLIKRVSARYGHEVPNLSELAGKLAGGVELGEGETPEDLGFMARNVRKLAQSATAYRPHTISSKTMELSGREYDPEDPSALNGIYQMLRMSRSPREANAILGRFVESPNLSERIAILSQANQDSIRVIARGYGLTDDEISALPEMQRYLDHGDNLVRNGMRRVMGYNKNGVQIIHHAEDGTPHNFGLSIRQTGKLSFPDWNQLRKDLNDVLRRREGGLPTPEPEAGLLSPQDFKNAQRAKQLRGALGSKDDWVAHHVTTPWKSLTLSTGGFATRVAAAELIPALIQNGAGALARGALSAIESRVTLRDLIDEYGKERFAGVHVVTPDNVHSTIKSITDDGRALLDNGEIHRLSRLDGVLEPLPNATIQGAAQNLGIKLSKREFPHVRAAFAKALHMVPRALVDEDYREMGHYNILTLNGHGAPTGLLTHSMDLEGTGAGPGADVAKVLHDIGAKTNATRLTEDWTHYGNQQAEQPMFHYRALQRHAQDPGIRASAKAFLRTIENGGDEAEATRNAIEADKKWMLSDDKDAEYLRRSMVHYENLGPEQYAAMRAELVKGLTYGSNGQLQKDVLSGLAGESTIPTPVELSRKAIDERPLHVEGEELGAPVGPLSGGILRLTNWGWHHVLNPIVNSLSRAPIFTTLSTQEWKLLKPAVAAGRLSKDEAMRLAQVRAAHRMLDLIHNTKLRSHLADTWRNAFPFYFAQEQAYRRYGRVILKDLPSFRKAMLGYHGLYSTGIVRQDGSGNQALVLPGATEFASGVVSAGAAINPDLIQGGIPGMISGDTISLRTVVPEGTLPSTSPLVAIPLEIMQKHFPGSEPLISKIIGPVNENESITDQLIPNSFFKRVLQATPILDREAAFQNSYAYALAAADYRARTLRSKADAIRATDPQRAARLEAQANQWLPGPNASTDDVQAAADRIRNTTRIYMMMKAAVGLISPLAPSLEIGDAPLRQEVRDLIDKHGVVNGTNEFIDRHPDATAYTVFLTDNKATGTSPPATQAALDWIDRNRSFVAKHGAVSAYLVPQSPGAYDQDAYNQELANGLRSRRAITGPSNDPARQGTFLSAIYAAATDPTYYAGLDRYLKAQQQYANDPYARAQLAKTFDAWKQKLINANPVWWASHNDGDKRRVAAQTLNDLRNVIDGAKVPDSPQVPYARQLIQSYDNYASTLQALMNGTQTGSQDDLKNGFNDYLDQYVKAHPQASALVTGIFRRLVND